jgi:hypothetical protein
MTWRQRKARSTRWTRRTRRARAPRSTAARSRPARPRLRHSPAGRNARDTAPRDALRAGPGSCCNTRAVGACACSPARRASWFCHRGRPQRTRTGRPVAGLTCASFLWRCDRQSPEGLEAPRGCRAGARARRWVRCGWDPSCYRSLSTAAPAVVVVGSSRPANGLAAMRARMSRVWRASSNRCV